MRTARAESKFTTPKKKAPFTNMAFKFGSRLHTVASNASGGGMFTANPEYRDPESMEVPKAFVPPPPVSESQEMPPPRTLSPRNCYVNNAEDYMSYDAVVDSRKASVANAIPIRRKFLEKIYYCGWLESPCFYSKSKSFTFWKFLKKFI